MAQSRKKSETFTQFTVTPETGDAFNIHVRGRDRWALLNLIEAGPIGCTPITTPGPRWSAYVFNLRVLGVPIETINEAHSGPFPGTHARYVLKSRVERASDGGAE